MPKRIFKNIELREGYTSIVSPENSELRYIEFGRIYLPEREGEYEGKTGGREAVLTIFGGRCSIQVRTPTRKAVYKSIGWRRDVFSGKPTMVYLPPGSEYTVKAESAVEIGVSMAPSGSASPPVLVKPEEASENIVGAWNWRRRVYTSVGENVEAERLLVGETFNPPGNWSSYPPHKHDSRGPAEVPLEEVYFFKVKPAYGFGLQRVYTSPDDESPFDEIFLIENDDLVVIPRGYHPVVAAPGYQLYYLWVLAGEERRYGAWSDDPRHRWVKDGEAIIKEALHG
ncbi:MAG: myo-inositol catabolism protein [Candidatus Bathyarchaeota archaeon B63]|nr:MAG: myo-inositol catabolism protein [Candidatus Bathyarchaeota archaeon B63]